MMKLMVITLFTVLSFSTFADESLYKNLENEQVENCQDVLNWIYKDFTLNNLELSYDRLMQKLILSVHYANKNNGYQKNKSINLALDKMKSIDSDFDRYIDTPKKFKLDPISNLLVRDNSTSPDSVSNIKDSVAIWAQLQKESPQFFEGMDKKFYLDEWDQTTLKLLENISNYNFPEQNVKESLRKIANELNAAKTKILKQQIFNAKFIERTVNRTHEEMLKSMIEGYIHNQDKFKSICSQNELSNFINGHQLLCPVPKKEDGIENIHLQLNNLAKVLRAPSLRQEERPKLPKVEINKLNYRVNPRATYCKRDPEMATMIVLHHTGESAAIDPIRINNNHIESSTNGDPWYQISYNYIINDRFQGATKDLPKVFEGRVPEVKGAHAGGYTERLTETEKEFYNNFPIYCGNETIGFSKKSLQSQLDRRGGISGNLVSFGIAVSGNFTDVEIENIGGVAVPETINVDQPGINLPTEASITKVAALACQLQKKHPNIKRIVPHSYFKRTDCPAALVVYFERIKELTAAYGCNFDINLRKGRL